ncbi:hypothetical protein REIFOR_02404 [Reinekea forsetii]|uniref:Uncharacterized protein n=1 Tax=Reinekea forsetii TaxID=1336806 RepID=A0A2K8KTX8_9GAMM|nr:hypothetical protein REIFOR_02404 [Reinekea forsetii]
MLSLCVISVGPVCNQNAKPSVFARQINDEIVAKASRVIAARKLLRIVRLVDY